MAHSALIDEAGKSHGGAWMRPDSGSQQVRPERREIDVGRNAAARRPQCRGVHDVEGDQHHQHEQLQRVDASEARGEETPHVLDSDRAGKGAAVDVITRALSTKKKSTP